MRARSGAWGRMADISRARRGAGPQDGEHLTGTLRGHQGGLGEGFAAGRTTQHMHITKTKQHRGH